jgi:hypothetical protein
MKVPQFKMLLFICAIHIATAALAENLPAQFDHDRIHLSVTGPDAQPVRIYVDSGGGYNAMTQTVRNRLGLAIDEEIEGDDGPLQLVKFPTLFAGAAIPAPLPDKWLGGRLLVVPDAELDMDAFLGSRWFAGRIWQIDYPNHAMSVLDSLPASKNAHRIPLAFRTGADGIRSLNFPRITISVDGASMEVLLDTGATARLTSTSAPVFNVDVGAEVGTSFVVRSAFEKWRKRHPGWRVVEKSDAGRGTFPMIEVPSIRVADMSVGPVWFTERSDEDFHNTMSEILGVPADGALGGSGLKYFRVILDYPAGNAYFSRPK